MIRLFSQEKKRCFVALRPLELHVNSKKSLTDECLHSFVLYPASAVVSSVVSSYFICELLSP